LLPTCWTISSGRTPFERAASTALRSSFSSVGDGSRWPGAQNELVMAASKPAAFVSAIFCFATAGSGSRTKYSQTPTSNDRSSKCRSTP